VTLVLNKAVTPPITSQEPCTACDSIKRKVFDPATFRADLKEANDKRMKPDVTPKFVNNAKKWGAHVCLPRNGKAGVKKPYSSVLCSYCMGRGENFDIEELQKTCLHDYKTASDQCTSWMECRKCGTTVGSFGPDFVQPTDADYISIPMPILPINPEHDKLVNDLVDKAKRKKELFKTLTEEEIAALPPIDPEKLKKAIAKGVKERNRMKHAHMPPSRRRMHDFNKVRAEQLVLQARVANLEKELSKAKKKSEDDEAVMIEMGKMFRDYRDTGKLPGSI